MTVMSSHLFFHSLPSVMQKTVSEKLVWQDVFQGFGQKKQMTCERGHSV